MDRQPSHPLPAAPPTHRLRLLATSIAALRRAHGPRCWIPKGLRAQVVAAMDAGIPASDVARVCDLSRGQLTRWRSAAVGAVAPAPAARMLSVVDTSTPASVLDAEIEVRLGPWRVRLSRVGDAR